MKRKAYETTLGCWGDLLAMLCGHTEYEDAGGDFVREGQFDVCLDGKKTEESSDDGFVPRKLCDGIDFEEGMALDNGGIADCGELKVHEEMGIEENPGDASGGFAEENDESDLGVREGVDYEEVEDDDENEYEDKEVI